MWFNFNVTSPAFKTVALIGRYNTAEIAESLLGLAQLLQQRGCSVIVEKETAANIGKNGFTGAASSPILQYPTGPSASTPTSPWSWAGTAACFRPHAIWPATGCLW